MGVINGDARSLDESSLTGIIRGSVLRIVTAKIMVLDSS